MSHHSDRLGELIAKDPAVEAVCHPSRIKALFSSTKKRARFAGWTLLFYALWHRRNIRNLPADGDTFECLAAR